MNKDEIRKIVLYKRNNMTDSFNKSRIIFERLKNEIKDYDNYFIYISFKNEVDTVYLINYLLQNGKKVVVPVCNIQNYTITPSQITSLYDFTENKYGILEPEFIKKPDFEIEVAITPGIAFDRKGNRIGFGKGYYDNFFSNKKNEIIKIGLCYDFQLMDNLPFDEHDVKMDMIVTEKETVYIQNN